MGSACSPSRFACTQACCQGSTQLVLAPRAPGDAGVLDEFVVAKAVSAALSGLCARYWNGTAAAWIGCYDWSMYSQACRTCDLWQKGHEPNC